MNYNIVIKCNVYLKTVGDVSYIYPSIVDAVNSVDSDEDNFEIKLSKIENAIKYGYLAYNAYWSCKEYSELDKEIINKKEITDNIKIEEDEIVDETKFDDGSVQMSFFDLVEQEKNKLDEENVKLMEVNYYYKPLNSRKQNKKNNKYRDEKIKRDNDLFIDEEINDDRLINCKNINKASVVPINFECVNNDVKNLIIDGKKTILAFKSDGHIINRKNHTLINPSVESTYIYLAPDGRVTLRVNYNNRPLMYSISSLFGRAFVDRTKTHFHKINKNKGYEKENIAVGVEK